MEVYDFHVKDTRGNVVPLASYRGKILLIVNTAISSVFSPQQYEGLQKLYVAYHDRGLEILDFPCNQFNGQAHGPIEDVVNTIKNKYHASFGQFAKVRVNGAGTEPLFEFLKNCRRGEIGNRVSGNFTKFLLDREGNFVRRYPPAFRPEAMAADIEKLL